MEDIEGRCDELITIKIDLDTKMEELQEKLDDEEELNSDLIKHRRKLEVESLVSKFIPKKVKNWNMDNPTEYSSFASKISHKYQI